MIKNIIAASGALAWFAFVGTAIAAPIPTTMLSVSRVAEGFDRPVYATHAPGGNPDHLYVVEQHTGNVLVLNQSTGVTNPTPFLNISDLSRGKEQGLLGLAFHPQYEFNGLFYVSYTDLAGDNVIEQYRRINDELADPTSAQPIISIEQPESDHNGGWIGFDLSGRLYAAIGDGGDDLFHQTAGIGNAQDKTKLLGKIIRIDVDADEFPLDHTRNYGIPANNPLVGETGVAEEIFALGFRNPWRNSFDRQNGDFYIGDVGESLREEINVLSSLGDPNRIDYGWRSREGIFPTPNGFGGDAPDAIDPVYDYAHGDGLFEGFSVVGGYVYRGPSEELQGLYFFADFVTGGLWSFRFDSQTHEDEFDGLNFTDLKRWNENMQLDCGEAADCIIGPISSFAEDTLGNVYIIDYSGELFRVEGIVVPEPSGLMLSLCALATLMMTFCERTRRGTSV